MDRQPFSIYGGRDPREVPTYNIPEAARYVGIPKATLYSWVQGRPYPTREGVKSFRRLIAPPDENKLLLSFVNLVEAHVLSALRRQHGVPLFKVRNALDFLNTTFASKHPLVEARFETDGVDLFVERYGQLINVSKHGQMAMLEVLRVYLQRVEHDDRGNVVRLFPFTRPAGASPTELDQPKIIVIDPFVSFGRRTVVGTGIPTAVIADRYKSGESIEELARDYARKPLEIEEAIRVELPAAA